VIPSGFIQDLLARADVVAVVGRHVELKKAGINYKGLCPFHGEKTPSFIVSPSRQTYHCLHRLHEAHAATRSASSPSTMA
jgi:DNA primase